ncbi:MAG: hypothetical protein LBJ12_01155 [Oscillospiraceae bacterium]|jgi:hypothetical protein|nr:hypothetical protein [Oscillospiraceae bacterium]
MRDIEQTIREVNGTMAIEGMPLTDNDKESLCGALRGEYSFAELIASIIAEYQSQRADA